MDHPIAFILCDQPAVIDMLAVAEAIRRRRPDVPVELIPGKDQKASEAPLIRCGDDFIVAMNIPAPLPRDQGDGIWARGAMTWPEAPAARDRHRAHLIVSTMGNAKDPLRYARVVTAGVGALLDVASECSAVMWGTRVVRPAALWRDQSRAAYAAYPDYPFLLWVDILPMKSGTWIGAVTIGLSSFVGREIEFEAGRLELSAVLNNIAGLAAYLVEHGDVIKDGDTFGGSEAERIKINHATSTHFADVPVLRITAV